MRRSKFSELVDAGVAKFEYTPILPETSQTDPICREYNNIFSMALDTHMSMLEDGRRIITGHNVATKKWNYFINCCQWGGLNFADSGYWTVNEFLGRFNLVGSQSIINGDIVWLVEECLPVQGTAMPQANESIEELNEAMPVVYVVNKKTNKSYLVAAKSEEDAIKMANESDKDDLKASVVEGLTIKGISNSIIFKDSDMVINGK